MLFWTRGRLAKHAMDGGAGGAIGLRELAEALPLSSVPQDADAIEIKWFAADVAAFELGATHAGAHSLCAGHVQQLGGASPLPDLMEVRVSKTQGLPSRDGV